MLIKFCDLPTTTKPFVSVMGLFLSECFCIEVASCSCPAISTNCCLQITLEEVNMNLTLEENGMVDGMSNDEMGLSSAYSPVLCLYWCDDLTVA